MRALWVGLVGAVLAVDAAEATECRGGRMTLVKDAEMFRVTDISHYEVTPKESASRTPSLAMSRTVLKGSLRGRPYLIDLQSMQGSSAVLTSYKGMTADTGGMPVRWGRRIDRWHVGGQSVGVEAGPLEGEWRVICR